MNICMKLEQLYKKANLDNELKQKLISTVNAENPVNEFCNICREYGFEIYEMELVTAGEEMYDSMKRSTNGGGANSPMLEGSDDFYELFIASLL